jgi:ferredoxin
MADRMRRLLQNIAGDFFVDDSCIDCDTCRQIAPAHFRDHGDQSSVYRQPVTAAEISQALKALVSCPTASIGTPFCPIVRVISALLPKAYRALARTL